MLDILIKGGRVIDGLGGSPIAETSALKTASLLKLERKFRPRLLEQ